MNLEFQSAGKSTVNGARGINAKAETPASYQSKGNERSAQFKDLLDQSKQDIKQAEQLEKVRENRRESKSIVENNRRENIRRGPQETKGHSDDGQAEELAAEELNCDTSQESSALPTIDMTQLIGVQSFQGGLETALTRLNLQLGQEETITTEGLNDLKQAVTLTVMDDQLQSVPGSESVPQLDGMEIDEFQVLQPNTDIENETVEDLQGLLKNTGIELVPPENLDKDVNLLQESVKQSSAIDEPEPQTTAGIRQINGEQAKEDEVATPLQVFDSVDSTDSDSISSEGLTKKSSPEESDFNTVQSTSLNQTEIQSPGEKGVQEINVTGLNANKGQEAQPNTKVEVAQQVEQKILQNFEPNKPMVLQMTLSPDNLGDIDIKLSYDQGKLIIDITALSQETQNLLGKQINQLVRGLALQNVQVETVHLNTPVEQSSDSQQTAFMMNSGADPNENQNQTLLREKFIKNSGILNSVLTGSDEDESVMIPQNLKNYSSHRVNYLI